MARRNGNTRAGFGRWDRREVGLRPENALSRVARKFSSNPRVFYISIQQPQC